MSHVLLGVSGGIAAYKACEVVRRLREAGHEVQVAPTTAALRFVGVPTWAALSGRPVSVDVFDDPDQVRHVTLARWAELVVVAPATADLLARAAAGRADDLLTAALLTTRAPVVLAPAMHTEMWEHPATQANVALLRHRGVVVIDPDVGRLAGPDSGPGRLPTPEALVETVRRMLTRGAAATSPDLAGRHVVVSAGGTREALDPVRFLGNRSSGRQGYALAATAVARGARVTLVAANVTLAPPAGVRVVPVVSAAELGDAVLSVSRDADAVVMAAAVADFRPAHPSATKIKKSVSGPPRIELVTTGDVLAALVAARIPGQVLVGFAAETGDAGADVLGYGRAKLAAKGVDLLVVNEVGEHRGFESSDNQAVVLVADGTSREVGLGPKETLADVVWDLVAARWQPGADGAGE